MGAEGVDENPPFDGRGRVATSPDAKRHKIAGSDFGRAGARRARARMARVNPTLLHLQR